MNTIRGRDRRGVAAYRHLTIAVLLVLGLGAAPAAAADEASGLRAVPASALAEGGLFFPGDEDGRLLAAPLLDTRIEADISGMVARYRLRHTFRNGGTEWTEAIYTFPLPTDAAVDRLIMHVGERTIDGVIKERDEARAAYQAAVNEGRRASLVDQERPNIFTTSVANIAPGESIVVEIGFQESIPYRDGRFELRMPLVIGPRYIPGTTAVAGIDGTGWASGTDRVPDAARITPPVRPADAGPGNPVSLSIRLAPGFPLAAVTSPSHAIDDATDDGVHTVGLRQASVPTDRDFVLRWTPAPSHEPAAGLFTEAVEGEHYLLLTVMPPTTDPVAGDNPPLPREVVFVVDRSGSMHGPSLEQAKAALAAALGRLGPDDRFNVVTFDDATEALFSQPVAADGRNLALARSALAVLDARGGTEIVPALAAALDGRRDPGRIRQVVLITDGAVGNEDELFGLIERRLGDSRLFTVGIGSAPNDYLMTRAAAAGRGSFVHIGQEQEVLARMSELFAKLESPVLTGITLRWPDGTAEMWPDPVPDLYAGEPLVVAARVPALSGSVRITGRLGRELWETTVPLSTGREGPGVASIWARARIRDLMATERRAENPETVRRAATGIALAHQLVSRYTSLVAVDTVIARPQDEPLQPAAVPTNMPDGWSREHVFGAPAKVRLFKDQPIETREAMRDAGFGAVASAAMPQTATAAPWHLLIAVVLLCLAVLVALAAWRRPGRPA